MSYDSATGEERRQAARRTVLICKAAPRGHHRRSFLERQSGKKLAFPNGAVSENSYDKENNPQR
jgi:hypothetical protein